MADQIKIFDTTLRDGEQCPGASMNPREKLEIAHQLKKLGVDIIEAGFPIISQGDFESVKQIASQVKGPIIAGLARCVAKDIEAAAAAVKPAGKKGRVHIFLATSKIHREFKLKKAEKEIVRLAVEGVKLAKSLGVKDIEFSPEDASRTEPEFLKEILEAVIIAGATTLNIPDTVGYSTPQEYGNLISYLSKNVRNIDDTIISVHCHNDLGLAVANSLAAIQNGARQVEGTINGIGERAGNMAIEEFIMAIKTRPDIYKNFKSNLKTQEIVKTSRLVSQLSNMTVQRNKAIVGLNAFAHGAGIHQDGILKKRETYEVMNPADVGWGETELPLTKHSGRNALSKRLEHLGFTLKVEEVNALFERFKDIGDKKKFVYDEDLIALAADQISTTKQTFELTYLEVSSGTNSIPTATVQIKHGDKISTESCYGDGAIDAAIKAIDKITQEQGELKNYQVKSSTEGEDAIGEVSVKVAFGKEKELVTGKAAATDVVLASARAYLNAVNYWLQLKEINKLKPKKKIAETV
jgi:2-isopropylmalate synthase